MKEDTWLFKHNLAALRSLLWNDSFSRAWVPQEVALARGILLLCGSRKCDFLGLVHTDGLIRLKLDQIEPVENCLANVDMFPEVVHKRGGGWAMISLLHETFFKLLNGSILSHRMTLRDLVTSLVHSQTTDLEERIHAQLSMAKGVVNIPQGP